MANFEYGVVSIKIQGKYDSEDQVFAKALEIVSNWQLENNRQGNFIFDREAIWWRTKTVSHVRPRAPRLPPYTPLSRRRRSAGSVSLSDGISALRIARSWSKN